MPIYTYECNKCGDITEDLRSMKDLHKVEKCTKCQKGKLKNKISGQQKVLMDQRMPEYIQYWKKDPNSPNGMKVFPHRNRYIGRGI